MAPDAMSIRLHLRRIRVVAVVVDLIGRVVVEVADTRRVVRCGLCGFKTAKVHESYNRMLWMTGLGEEGGVPFQT